MKTKAIHIHTATAFFMIALFFAGLCFAGEKATIEEVYDKVREGVHVLEMLGEEGLEAFNGTEFVWKDSNVVVVDCEKKILVATSNTPLIGASTDIIVCKTTGNKLMDIACENIKPSGFWMDYFWPNPAKQGKIERRVTFSVPVPGTSWLVAGSVWDETISVDELNKPFN